MPTGHARFAYFPAPVPVPRGQAALTLGQGFLLRPLRLQATSPDPEGREVPVVEHELGFSLGVAIGLGQNLELSALLPVTLLRGGLGVSGVTAQNGTELQNTAVYDPSFGLAYTPWVSSPGSPFGVKARFDISLPMGEEDVFAGYAGPGFLPALDAELTLGRLSIGAELGARLGDAVDFATSREGSWFSGSLGFAVELLERNRLALSLEGTLRQGFGDPEVDPGTAVTSGPAAEWLAALRSADGPYSALLGAGTGLPLARERRDSGEDEFVFAPTAPTLRALLRLELRPRVTARRRDPQENVNGRPTF